MWSLWSIEFFKVHPPPKPSLLAKPARIRDKRPLEETTVTGYQFAEPHHVGRVRRISSCTELVFVQNYYQLNVTCG